MFSWNSSEYTCKQELLPLKRVQNLAQWKQGASGVGNANERLLKQSNLGVSFC